MFVQIKETLRTKGIQPPFLNSQSECPIHMN